MRISLFEKGNYRPDKADCPEKGAPLYPVPWVYEHASDI